MLILSITAVAGCASVAIATAPAKRPVPDASAAARGAEELFWKTLHTGDYRGIEPALQQLQAVFLADPNDPNITAHIAFLHIWRISERDRDAHVLPTITDDMTLARRYFQDATVLAPHDARFSGFWAAATMAEGKIHADERQMRSGFYAMADAVDAWPEFNLFTRGYVMSSEPYGSERLHNALDDQWRVLDLCAGERVSREQPDFGAYMDRETQTGSQRACWNSWIAPHNFEGFFLNMGDMLVKSGAPAVARLIYAQAKHAKTYTAWPYRSVLEERIRQANANMALFRAPQPENKDSHMMVESRFACAGCHQAVEGGVDEHIGRSGPK